MVGMMTNTNHPKVVQALHSVDWLTMTLKRSYGRNTVAQKAYDFLEESIATGNDTGKWEQHGYAGWYCNSVRWGRREMDDILQLSGDAAGHLWQEYLPYADNVSRVDLAVTLKFDQSYKRLINDQWESLQLAPTQQTKIRRYSKTEGLTEGFTLYVGSRSSAQFGRLYDKQAESKNATHWLNCLRWEVEYKKPLAWEVAAELGMTAYPDQYIYQRVYGWFTDRYIYVPDLGHEKIPPLHIPRKMLPDEKRLEWLSKQVRPTVDKLRARGYSQRLRGVLGFDNDETPF